MGHTDPEEISLIMDGRRHLSCKQGRLKWRSFKERALVIGRIAQ